MVFGIRKLRFVYFWLWLWDCIFIGILFIVVENLVLWFRLKLCIKYWLVLFVLLCWVIIIFGISLSILSVFSKGCNLIFFWLILFWEVDMVFFIKFIWRFFMIIFLIVIGFVFFVNLVIFVNIKLNFVIVFIKWFFLIIY